MNRLSAWALLSLAAVAGCGGGLSSSSSSSGSASTSSTTPAVDSTVVSGTAAKGIIKQAKVLVCRIVNGAPEPDATCAFGTTGADGSYTVTMGDGYTGPAMVKVMAGTGSTMMDETTGTDVPYSMTMRAVVSSVSGATTVHVTPFSEMAASAASLSMPMDATKISQAIGAVQNAMTTLGIDMSVMPIVDLKNDGTDAAKLGMEANMVKQLSRVAMAARNSSQLKDASGVPCNAAGTTATQQISCAVAAMAGAMTSYVSFDPAKLASIMSALNAQNVANVTMPVRQADGTMGMQIADMTSLTSMQAAMQNAGMTATAAATITNVMMGRMH
jgi:hypothetical protein